MIKQSGVYLVIEYQNGETKKMPFCLRNMEVHKGWAGSLRSQEVIIKMEILLARRKDLDIINSLIEDDISPDFDISIEGLREKEQKAN